MYTAYLKHSGILKLQLKLLLDDNVSYLLHEASNIIKWGFNETLCFAILGIGLLHIFT